MSDEALMRLSQVAFMTFAGVCFLTLISVFLKTKWWRTATGLNVVILSGWFCFVVTLGILGTLELLPEWLRQWARFIIYASGSLILMWRVVVLWVWNWNFWAWSKTERNE